MPQEETTALIGTRDHSSVPAKVENTSEITDLIRVAMEKGVDVAVLERLVALKERVTDRDARMSFMAAVAAFQRECPVILKNKAVGYESRSGGSVKYAYAPLEQIAKDIAPSLEKHGLSYRFTTEEAAHPNVLLVVCILSHVDGHEERARFPVPTQTDAKMSGAQKVGSALTYGRRQSLVSVLGIVTADEDDDAGPDNRQSAEFLTEDQVEKINKRIDATGCNFNKLMEFMGVNGLGEIRQSDYDKCMQAINRTEANKREGRR